MGEERRVLKWGGIAGLVAGVLLIVSMVAAVTLSPIEPPTGIPDAFERFSRSVLEPVQSNAAAGVLFVAALILAALLYVALFTLWKSSAAFILGSVSGVLGLILLSLLVVPPYWTDQYWWSLAGMFLLALSFMAVGAGMLAPDSGFHGAFGSTSVSLGFVGFGAGIYGVDYVGGMFVGILALVLFLLLLGWKVAPMSKET